MKVYAKYFSEYNVEYRKNTLLKFGVKDNWELIGSLFLINPGSAKPISDQQLEGDVMNRIIEFLPNEQGSNNWYEFRADPTMRFVESLFSGKYINKSKELNGVIQLFNLFNLRDANLENAILEMSKNNQNLQMFSYQDDLKLIKEKPVYLGWGAKGKTDKVLNKLAREIFDLVKSGSGNQYLKERFEDNTFYHPRYIQMSYKKPHLQAMLNNFSDPTRTYSTEDFGEYVELVSKKDFEKAVKKLLLIIGNNPEGFIKKYQLEEIIENKEKLIRLSFITYYDDKLTITITSQDSGYIGIRSLEEKPHYNQNLKYKNYSQQLVEALDFEETNNYPWLGKKMVKNLEYILENKAATDINNEVIIDAIIDSILEFIKKAVELLKNPNE